MGKSGLEVQPLGNFGTSERGNKRTVWSLTRITLTDHPSTVLVYSLLLQAGDVQPNPGPYKLKSPCAVCSKALKRKQMGIQCDKCDAWYCGVPLSLVVYNQLCGSELC